MDALCQVAKGQDQGVPGSEQVRKKQCKSALL